MKPKEKLTQAVLKALNEFEEETGVEIQTICVRRLNTMNFSESLLRKSIIREIKYELE